MPPTPGNALPIGSRLDGGKFVIDACLGQGGFGITYRAEEKALRRTVAIKEFFPSACTRAATLLAPAGGWTQGSLDAFKSKFLEEGQMLARLLHAGIPHIYGVFEENGTAYLVMQYVEGQTLDAYLTSRGGKLPIDEATSIIRKAGETLQVVHAASLIHRDIKPSNIMVRSDGQVILIDFGAAREFVPDAVYSQSQTVILTPGYAPLEQYSRQGVRGPFTDIYALAATLYHLLTGRRPADATDRATGVPLSAPRDLRPEVPKQVSDAVMTGLRLRAEERPQSAAEFCKRISTPVTPPPERQARHKPDPVASNYFVQPDERLKFAAKYVAATTLTYCVLFASGRTIHMRYYSAGLWPLLLEVIGGLCIGAIQWALLSKRIPLSKLFVASTVLAYGLIHWLRALQPWRYWSRPEHTIVVGLIIGLTQWYVLRPASRQSWVWIPATMIGYLLPVICFQHAYIASSAVSGGSGFEQLIGGAVLSLVSACQAIAICFMRKAPAAAEVTAVALPQLNLTEIRTRFARLQPRSPKVAAAMACSIVVLGAIGLKKGYDNHVSSVREAKVNQLIKDGAAAAASGDFSTAIGQFDKALASGPTPAQRQSIQDQENDVHVTDLTKQGDAAYVKKDYTSAEDFYEKALASLPTPAQRQTIQDHKRDAQVYELNVRGDREYFAGLYSSAITYYEQAQKLNPTPAERRLLQSNLDYAHHAIVQKYIVEGTDARIHNYISSAVSTFQQALKESYSYAQRQTIYANLTYLYIAIAHDDNAGRYYASAKTNADAALVYDSDNWWARYELAAALKGLGDSVTAEDVDKKRMATLASNSAHENQAESFLKDGDSYNLTGNTKLAREKWESAVLAAPGSSQGITANARLLNPPSRPVNGHPPVLK